MIFEYWNEWAHSNPILNWKELKSPFKYIVVGMGNAYPNTPESLKKEISHKSCAAPPVTSHASNLKCMSCRKELLMKSTMEVLTINWVHLGQILLPYILCFMSSICSSVNSDIKNKFCLCRLLQPCLIKSDSWQKEKANLHARLCWVLQL